MHAYKIIPWADDKIGQGFSLYRHGQYLGTSGSIKTLRTWARHEWKHCRYWTFLDWCDERGFEFPCTAAEFAARTNQYAKGNQQLINHLCRIGIGD